MAFLDVLFGSSPEPYDWRSDPLAQVDAREAKSHIVHVRECLNRWVDLQTAIGQLRIEQHRQNRLLWFVIALLVANKIVDVSTLTALMKFAEISLAWG